MRVLHVVHWLDSGIGAVVDDLITEHKKLGIESELLVLEHKEGCRYGKDSEVIYTHNISKHPMLKKSLIWDVFSESTADVVHSHSLTPMMFASKFGDRMKKVRTFHSDYPYLYQRSPKAFAKRFLENRYLKRQDAIVAVSDPLKELLEWPRTNHRNVVSIPNGIRMYPEAIPERAQNNPLVIGAAGRLNAQKGFDRLIKAIPYALQVRPVHLRIAGDGELREELEALVASIGLQDVVTFLGRVDNMQQFYLDCDAFVSSSNYEGFGLAPMEALACGTPVLVTWTAGVSRIIHENDWGLVSNKEPKHAFIGGLQTLMHTLSRCKERAMIARECIKTQYTTQKMASSYLQLYESAA